MSTGLLVVLSVLEIVALVIVLALFVILITRRLRSLATSLGEVSGGVIRAIQGDVCLVGAGAAILNRKLNAIAAGRAPQAAGGATRTVEGGRATGERGEGRIADFAAEISRPACSRLEVTQGPVINRGQDKEATMELWWIGNVVFILVVIPVVVVLLQRLARSAIDVGKHIDTIHDQAQGIAIAVDDVKQLIPTGAAVKRVGIGLTRYVKAVARVL